MRWLFALVFSAMASGLARADPRNAPSSGANGVPGLEKQVRYEYRYAVDDPSSGVVSQRWEHRLGEYVKGAYSLVEPDGSVRHVDYEVDGKRGFHAIIRTTPPVNSLLSADQLSKSRQHHSQPPVNVLTNQPEAAASASVSAGVHPTQQLNPSSTSSRAGRRLPINFHSVRPDYYLAFAKGEPARYRESTPALELPLETPAEVEESHPSPPPAPPAPARLGHASSHHHHLAALHSPGADYSTLRALLGGPPPAPQQVQQHAHHVGQLQAQHSPQALQALRVFQAPQGSDPFQAGQRTTLTPASPSGVPRGRALYTPTVGRGAAPSRIAYPTHTEVIFQPFPPITLAADLFAG